MTVSIPEPRPIIYTLPNMIYRRTLLLPAVACSVYPSICLEGKEDHSRGSVPGNRTPELPSERTRRYYWTTSLILSTAVSALPSQIRMSELPPWAKDDSAPTGTWLPALLRRRTRDWQRLEFPSPICALWWSHGKPAQWLELSFVIHSQQKWCKSSTKSTLGTLTYLQFSTELPT